MPEEVPVFTTDDILISTETYEYKNKKTTLGWLKELFLYHYVDDKRNCFEIRTEDRKDFKEILDKFQTCAKIKKTPTIEHIHEWEEDPGNTPKQQAAALNRLRKKLGYIVERTIE